MRRLLFALAAGLLLSLGVVHPAGATPPMSATFVGQVDVNSFHILSTRQADGNLIATYRFEQTLSGDVTGTDHEAGTNVFHPDGHATIHASGVCDPCTLLTPTGPRTGVMTSSVQATGTWVMGPMGPVVLSYHGTIRGSGSGGLAGLHSEGTVDQANPFSNPLVTIQYHFDP